MAADDTLNPSLWAVDRLTGRLVPLPYPVKIEVSDVGNDAGALAVEYPVWGSGFELLRDYTTDDSDLEVEIWLEGRRASRMVGFLDQASGDNVAESATWQFTGNLISSRLDEAEVFPQDADEKKEFRVNAATPGGILTALVAQAKGRGTLTDLTVDFTGTADSGGVAWPESVTAKWSPGVSILAVAQRLAELGYIDFTVTPDRVFRVWRFGGRGVDRSTGSNPVTLRRGQNLLDAGRRRSVRGAGTDFLVGGAEGNYTTATDANARARRGRQIERYFSIGNIDQPDALTAAAQKTRASGVRGEDERSFSLALAPGLPRPGLGLGVGDTVRADTSGAMGTARVAQWNVSFDVNGPQAGVTCGDLIRSRAAALQKRLTDSQNGDLVSGTSTATDPEAKDTGIPRAPEGVVVGSTAFQEGSYTYSSVTVGWAAVTSNVDGTAATDLEGYRVEYALQSSPTKWNLGADVAGDDHDGAFTMEPKVPIRVRVQARDRSGNRSAWSAEVVHVTEDDATPPPLPSTPVVADYLGTVRISWDGKTSAGADMDAAAPDFSYVEVHLSTTSNFTPDPATTMIAQLYGRGTWTVADLPYGVTQFARLVAVDTRGNRTAATPQGSGLPGKLVNIDFGPESVERAAIKLLAVGTGQIDNLAVNNAKIADLSVGKLTAGTMSADVIVAGIFRTALTGGRTEFDNAGIRGYHPDGTMRLQWRNSDGSLLVTGEYRTASSGARIVLNPLGSSAAESRWYPSDGVRYSRIKPTTSVATGFEGQGGITMKAYTGRSDKQSGEVAVYPGFASIAFGAELDDGDISSRISASETNAFVSAPRVQISAQSGTAFSDDAVIRLGILNNAGTTYVPSTVVRIATRSGSTNGSIGITNQHCYIQFDNAGISAVNDTVFINMYANAFVVSSERRFKTDIGELPFDPVEVVLSAPAYRYRRYDEDERSAHQQTPVHVGLMVDDLPAELVVNNADQGTRGVSLYAGLATLWGATRVHLERMAALEQEVAHLRARLDGPTLVGAA